MPVRAPCCPRPRAHGHITDGGARNHASKRVRAGQQRAAQSGAAVCKTVGSAYVGSNPTPATHLRRSKPVTLDCVTGFRRERERLRRPSAVSRGLCVGRIRPSADIG